VGQIAGEAFVNLGHRRILYFANYQYRHSKGYEHGLRRFLEANGLNLPASMVYYGPGDSEPEEVRDVKKDKMLHEFLTRKDRPTAIFCNDDTAAERVYWVAHELGMKVPEELSIIGFGDLRRDSVSKKKLTSVTVNEYELGVKAATLLCEMRNGKRAINDNEVFFIDLKLVPGTTLGPAPL
jgi:DNA-binding LacI/PurR family transcriptional regulator